MSDYGVTADGYVLKTQAEINSEAETSLENVVDPVSGEKLQVDFESSDIVAQIASVTLEGVGDGLLVDQACYSQFDPTTATGDALSALATINGITRESASNSTVILNFVGTPFSVINQLITVTDTSNSNNWTTDAHFIFLSNGTASVPATCKTAGNIEANANTLTVLVTAESEITAVTNNDSAVAGSDEESDTNLRRRRDLSTEAPSIGLPTSLWSALSNLENVSFVRVYNNITNAIDSNGIPAKTMAITIVGGDDEEIGQTILSRRGDGADTAGNTIITFQDEQGFSYPVRFYRPTFVEIFVDLTIEIVEDDVFPATGVADIKQAIVDYSKFGAPGLGVTDGFDTDGFPPGSDVIYSRLFTPINFVPGHKIDTLKIGFTSSPTGEADLPIGFNFVASFVVGNIEVTIA